ncbi:Gfo/Idh/MocA family protein [Domibacillus enclensis]|uniref:Oxidoreductase n=1 Tax=Domibacillus enclensis TaxID=1017273 RepID=A0A1N6RGX2_9BACI|nr:Gfo/Idh/MocA family oxidoreductase [Domibacillus enclensis]OXS79058.1 oxidoreductase [Domibacillus enclensis]SIQ28110.1 Predicted dehydrogenase [Domibacillus enclensis]
MSKKDGMNYAPKGNANRVVEKGEFVIAAMRLDHGHIYGMCNGLTEAGAEVKWVYDPNPERVAKFIEAYPEAKAAESEEQILADPEVKLVAAAAVPNERGPLGCKVMESGKDYFTDKSPFTTMEQLEQAKEVAARTGQKYMVYYSERIHVESAVYAGQLIEQGAIGRVLQVSNFAPHLLNAPSRPDWFFEKEKYGGILCDIGSHQIEQFLYYTGNTDAEVVRSQVANYTAPDYPELEDFGDCMLVGENGSTQYFRVDWLTPDGLGTWGDGRAFIQGTEGYIEVRKYIDIARDGESDHVYWANGEGTFHEAVKGKVGFPFFGDLILDCLNRTENAMTQEHAFKAAELCLIAQEKAVRLA